ncbi:thiol-disulfide oxidoreductase ResA [Halalkalicoccus paucihalophilus]|uniref:Thiol-disulfide oxidoreductase ResA n=2 Tax=Halalkalicoccus paucihalophilus TaxID=1008153 RepID=A0A151AHQ8_9EURY|nr:thiol-disulfide oxidoreductase ResA [Halalkalicoccus paucihalophilus]
MRDINRRRMIQLSGGIALASMAGCLGSDDDPKEKDNTGDKNDDTGGGKDTKDNDKPESGDDAPKADVETDDGKTVTIESKGKPVVVMFGDVENEKCKSYSETLVDLHEEYGDRAYMLTVNTNMDVSMEDLKEFHERYGGDWDHAMGTKDLLEKYGIETTVTICVIDEDGTVAFRTDGDIDRKTVEKALEVYVDGDIDEKDIEKALDAYREGEVSEEDLEEILDAYEKGDIDGKDIEEAIETYADD